MSNKNMLDDYTGRCGGCIHFRAYVINGKSVRRGECDCARTDYFRHKSKLKENPYYMARHSKYRSASSPKCRRYYGVDTMKKEKEQEINKALEDLIFIRDAYIELLENGPEKLRTAFGEIESENMENLVSKRYNDMYCQYINSLNLAIEALKEKQKILEELEKDQPASVSIRSI